MHHKTIQQLQQMLANKEVSSTELTKHFINRIANIDSHINSYISVTDTLALEQAKHADQRLANGDNSPLLGIPFAHKDIFCTTGVKTSCGSKMLDNFIAPYNATVTQKLFDAGMVMLGKTNMDEFAMGSSNETSFYGSVKNPWNTDRVPGGSSGGSVAAIAAGLAPCSTGTDTGGSIRQPAAFTGLTGLKPTCGRVSRWGMIAFASSLDQGGPIARTAEDTALLLNAMAGFDAKDSTSMQIAVPDYTAQLNDSIQGVKIGLPKQYFTDKLDSKIADLIMQAARQLETRGAILQEIDLPHVDMGIPAYYVVASTECSSNLSRYDGVRFGYRCHAPKNLDDLYKRSRGEGFGDEVKRRLMIGSYVSSAGYYDAYYLQAQKIRRLIRDDFAQAFTQVDMILSPNTPNVAFKLGEKTADPISMYLSDLYTVANNLAGLPGISVPCGFIDGLPVGLQLTSNHFTEAKLLNLAHQYQQMSDHHQHYPEEQALCSGKPLSA